MKLGNYELIFDLASGGMASVHIARQVGAAGFERLVVIKRVHRHLLSDREFYDMFRDEARISSVIRHPNVVPVIDVVETAGELFLALEYVESVSLSGLLDVAAKRQERLAPAIVSRILSDMLAGLHAAHEAIDMRGRTLDIVHRDVSPQNVIIGADGTSRLIDFGISKAATRVAATKSGDMKGKLAYMAPEQARRQPLDRRSDLFSAGIVLFEALTGQRLFHGDDDGAVLFGVLADEIPDPTQIAPTLPKGIDAVASRALRRERDLRFQTAREFQEALEQVIPPASPRDVARVVEQYVGDRLAERREALQKAIADLRASSGSIEVRGREPASHPVAEGEPTPAQGTTFRLRRRNKVLLPLAAAAVLLGAGSLFWSVRGTSHAPGPASTSDALSSPSAPSLATPEIVSAVTAPHAPALDAGSSRESPPPPNPPTSRTVKPRQHPAPGASSGLHRNPYQ